MNTKCEYREDISICMRYIEGVNMADRNENGGYINYEDYPGEQHALVAEFNDRLRALRDENARLMLTISEEEQALRTRINRTIRTYNINLSRGLIEDEIYEELDGAKFAILNGLDLPCPCPLKQFIVRTSDIITSDEEREAYFKYFDRERLLDEYANDRAEQKFEYTCCMPGKQPRTISNIIVMYRNHNTNDVIAMCSSKDITQINANKKHLEEINDSLLVSMRVNEGLAQDFHTVWVVNTKTLDMTLYKNNGAKAASAPVERIKFTPNYNDAYRVYIDEFVAEFDRERVRAEACPENIFRQLERKGIFRLVYTRIVEGEPKYYQMVFARTADPGYYVLAFIDVDENIRRENAISKRIKEQFQVVEALSRDYLNIFKIYVKEGICDIVKLDGYVTDGLNPKNIRSYAYDMFMRRYVRDRVYPPDAESLIHDMSLENVMAELETKKEYSSGYRVIENGEIHYYQFNYIKLGGEFSDEYVIAAFKNIDAMIKAAVERESLIEKSQLDLMTGVMNRGSGEKRTSEMLRCSAGGMLCILDVDNFKGINDTYGHVFGDKVLMHIANSLKVTFRDDDIIFRLGGDEFVAYAPNVISEKDGRHILARFMDRIASFEVEEADFANCPGGKEITAKDFPGISVSAGALIVKEGDSSNFTELYEIVDKALYESKKLAGPAVTFA